MTRTLLCTLALIAALAVPDIGAAAPMVRATNGQSLAMERDTLVVNWKLDDRDSLVALQLAVEAARIQGIPVVAVNLDGANSRSRVAPYLRAQGLRFDGAVVGVDAPWLADLTDQRPGVVILGDAGEAAARVVVDGGGAESIASLVTLLGLLDLESAVAAKPTSR